VYIVITDPPLETGAVHERAADVVDATMAVTPVGAPGTVAGVALALGAEVGPVPAALVAVTVKV
jgi:hypothetical protein